MKARVGALAANKFNNAIQHSTISITSLRSGVGDPPKVNVIPSVAEATLDCRVLPGTSRDEWLSELSLESPERRIRVAMASNNCPVSAFDNNAEVDDLSSPPVLSRPVFPPAEARPPTCPCCQSASSYRGDNDSRDSTFASNTEYSRKGNARMAAGRQVRFQNQDTSYY